MVWSGYSYIEYNRKSYILTLGATTPLAALSPPPAAASNMDILIAVLTRVDHQTKTHNLQASQTKSGISLSTIVFCL